MSRRSHPRAERERRASDSPTRKKPRDRSHEARDEKLALRKRLFREEPSRVAREYLEGLDLADRLRKKNKIGTRAVRRKAQPPRQQPLNILKREIYRLAWEIKDRRMSKALISYVRKRDTRWGQVHRPRGATVIEWTIRLVRGALRDDSKQGSAGEPLFDATLQSRISTELKFAFDHRIRPDFVTMFTDEMGGHEIISAMRANGEYDFTNETWIHHIQRRMRSIDQEELIEIV